VNISIAEISKPSDRIISMILPASPLRTECGLMMQSVQLEKAAVLGDLFLKKKSHSLFQLGPESLP